MTDSARLHVLVTNDDGIDSHGLHVLASVAVEAGLDVVVAAPHREASGSSAALTSLTADGRLVVHDVELPDLEVERAVGVEAAPAFIAFVAVRGAFGEPPDLVLSGVNHGPNTGHAVLHSGTVGAALTASTHGVRAMAVSMATPEPRHWGAAKAVSRQALDWLLAAPPDDPVVLNINVPDVPEHRLRGLRRARLAPFGAVQAEVVEAGEGAVTLTFNEVTPGSDPGTDAALVAEGWATLTPLLAPCEARGVDLSAVADRA